MNFEPIYLAVSKWAVDHGIAVGRAPMAPKQAGEFDGLSATMNAHFQRRGASLLSCSRAGEHCAVESEFRADTALFEELRAAKESKREKPARLEAAIERYRAFEIESSELAVWLLAELGQSEAIPPYTNFMRADLEALTHFHRVGIAPVWRDFFAHWNDEVRRGLRTVEPFRPKPIPQFKRKLIEKQEILQKQPEQNEASQ